MSTEEEDKSKAKAYNDRGVAFKQQGRNQDAINEYTKAIECNPNDAIAYHNRGVALKELGRKEEAISDYSKAIKIDPQNPKHFINRGNLFNQMGQIEEAHDDFFNALKIDPQNPIINVEIGVFLFKNSQNQKANEYFSKGLKLIKQITQQEKKRYHLSETSINFIKNNVNMILQIQVKQIIRSKTLTEDEENYLEKQIKHIDKDNINVLELLQKQIQDLQLAYQKVNQDNINIKIELIEVKNLNSHKIKQEMDKLKQDPNKQIYYQSLYWKLYNYISACQQLSTNLFQKNTGTEIENNSDQVLQVIAQVVQQFANNTSSIPILGLVIRIINSALVDYQDDKFEIIVKKLTQIVQRRCNSKNDIDEQIQLAAIILSNQLPQIASCSIESSESFKYQQEICLAEVKNGNNEAKHPYWKQGIVDTLTILQNMLKNYEQIQHEKTRELHQVIMDQLQENPKQIAPPKSTNSMSKKCSCLIF